MDISNNIKTLRKQKNLSQERLAKKLNLSPQNISKWENGISEPSISYCVKMAEIFNISLDSFLCRKLNNYDELELWKEREFNNKVCNILNNTFPSITLGLICEFKKDHDINELDDILNIERNYAYTKTDSKQFKADNFVGRSSFTLISLNENIRSNSKYLKSKENSTNKTYKEIKSILPSLLKEKLNYLYSKKTELLDYMKKYEGGMVLVFWQTYSTPFFADFALTPKDLNKLKELNIKFDVGIGNAYYELKKFMDNITI